MVAQVEPKRRRGRPWQDIKPYRAVIGTIPAHRIFCPMCGREDWVPSQFAPYATTFSQCRYCRVLLRAEPDAAASFPIYGIVDCAEYAK